ncbi:hypothetical protein F0562_000103 [Nyssa sinensis]|uniref:Uncharacterized protein n=1 Tax=Nyssa sinensis TaxID=561372 RepID=A0A5J5BZP8_9ASTE|nr:hypothetical protein F0562_000103 [Nyssa sinensis]
MLALKQSDLNLSRPRSILQNIDGRAKMGRFRHGLFGECAWEIGSGIAILGHSLCMQVMCISALLQS